MSHRHPQTWQNNDNDNIYLTTDSSLIPLDQLNDLFAQPDLSWGKPLSHDQLQILLKSSICFAMFEWPLSIPDDPQAQLQPQFQRQTSNLIGLGRWITDDVTVVYVNDIYIAKSHRGKGLAKWMLQCMNEQLRKMPDLRGTIMIVERDTPTERMYRRYFGMEDLNAGDILLDRKGPGSTSKW